MAAQPSSTPWEEERDGKKPVGSGFREALADDARPGLGLWGRAGVGPLCPYPRFRGHDWQDGLVLVRFRDVCGSVAEADPSTKPG